jgi:TolB protein
MDVSREGETNQWRQLTTGPASDLSPCWSPDGTEIAFVSGSAGIYKVDLSSLKETRLTGGPGDGYATWSPDGKKLGFDMEDDALYVMNADGSNTIPVFEAAGVSASAPDWHPDP